MARSVQNLNNDLVAFFRESKQNRNPGNRYYKFYCFVAQNPFINFSIEVIFKTESHFELLKHEYLLLQEGKLDENCLNTEFEPYIPQFTQSNKKKAWLNRGSYLNYMDWKQKYETKQLN